MKRDAYDWREFLKYSSKIIWIVGTDYRGSLQIMVYDSAGLLVWILE